MRCGPSRGGGDRRGVARPGPSIVVVVVLVGERRGRGAAGSAARGGWGLGETSLARLPCASAASAAGRKYSSERRGFGRWRAEIWAKPVVRGLTDTI